MARQTVLLVYGGESTEHDVSVRSTRSVFAAMDGEKYDTLLCYIDSHGKWWLLDRWTEQLDEHGGSQLVAALGSHSFLVLPGNALIRPDVIVPLLIDPHANDAVVGLARLLHISLVASSPDTSSLARHLEAVSTKLARRDITLDTSDSMPDERMVVALVGTAKEPTLSGVADVVEDDAPDEALRSVGDDELARKVVDIARGTYETLRCRNYALITVHRRDDRLALAAVDVSPELGTSGIFLKLWRMSGVHYPEVVDTLIATARK
ncbi:MAG: hypothetical protein ABIP74_03170 [Candidatus Saccharimonas sp.]